MFCPQCGTANKDGASFCCACGQPLAAGPAPVNPQGPVPQGMGPAPAATAPRSQGPLGAAWSDITGSQGWVKRLFLLMVMGALPVLGFFVDGYLLRWSAELVRGERTSLPRGVFDSRACLTGFLYWAVTMLCNLVSGGMAALGLIPILGWIAIVFCNLIIGAYAILGGIRIGLSGRFGTAFDLSQITCAIKRNVGGVLAIVVVPAVVTVAVAVLLGILLGTVVLGPVLSGLGNSSYAMYGYYGMDSSLYAMQMIQTVLSSLGAIIGVVALLAFVLSFCSVFANLWSIRAMGHWVTRYAPEWADGQSIDENAATGGFSVAQGW